MANISLAKGDVNLYAPDTTTLAKFLYLHTESERHAEYTTTFDEPLDTLEEALEFVETSAMPSDEGGYVITLSFWGYGRWSFRNNIDWFFDILKDPENHYYLQDKPDLIALSRSISDAPITADWEYVDSEAGQDYISDWSVVTKWDPETQETILEQETINDETDYNADTLIAYGYHSYGEIWDTKLILSDYDSALNYIKQSKELGSLGAAILANPEGFKSYISQHGQYAGVWDDFYEYLIEGLELSANSTF